MGTHQKIMQVFRTNCREIHPEFILLAHAPSSSMIGSDLAADAEYISQESGLPAASVNVHGDKDYLYGISLTLEAIGKLLLEKQETVPHTVNLLGCNTVDWHTDTCSGVEEMLHHAGYTLLSCWGLKESTENLKKASAASLNWVVNISGLRLAQFMEREFGIPYVVGAPFGKVCCDILNKTENKIPTTEPPEMLVIGEQLTANAIRSALWIKGWKNIRVLSFYEMNDAFMLPGDKKLKNEDSLSEQMQIPSVQFVIADPDYKAVTKRELLWLALPNPANQSGVNHVDSFHMVGAALDVWLDQNIKNWRKP